LIYAGVVFAALNTDEDEPVKSPPVLVEASSIREGGGSNPGFVFPEAPVWRDQVPEPVEIADLGVAKACDQVSTSPISNMTSTETDEIRFAAANQALTSIFPNTVNMRSGRANRLTVTIEWSDGGRESFEHVTMSSQQWRSTGPPKGGDGVAGSACKKTG
jgi:hypothetical protein